MMDPRTDLRQGYGGQDNPDVVHESSDVNVRAILWFCAGLLVVGAIVHAAIGGLFAVLDRQAVRATPPPRFPLAREAAQKPAGPLLQADPARDWRDFRAQEEKRLNQYQWIDRQKGIVQIPIDRAMDIVVKRGLPTRPTNTETTKNTEVTK